MLWDAQLKFIGIALGAAVLAASHWYAYDKGNTTGRNAVLVKAQANTIAVMMKQAADDAATLNALYQQAKKANTEHEQELAKVHAAADALRNQRVRIDRGAFCGGAQGSQAAEAGSAGQTDAGAAFLPDTFAADLRRLAEQADEVTADLRSLKLRTASCFE